MRKKLNSNENFPIPVVEELRKLGHDVLTIQETGMALQALTDEQVLKFAIKNDRAVMTFNCKHFIALHDKFSNHKGIIVCSVDLDFKGLAQRIHQNIATMESLDNQLIRINRPLI